MRIIEIPKMPSSDYETLHKFIGIIERRPKTMRINGLLNKAIGTKDRHKKSMIIIEILMES